MSLFILIKPHVSKNQNAGPKTNIDPKRLCGYVPFYDPTTLVTALILRSYRVKLFVVSFHFISLRLLVFTI